MEMKWRNYFGRKGRDVGGLIDSNGFLMILVQSVSLKEYSI